MYNKSEMEKFYIHTIFENCGSLKIKRDEKVFLFHLGRSQDLTGQGKLTKREHKLLRGPHNGARVEKILKIAFENVSKIDYIALVSGHLKDIGYSLNPNQGIMFKEI